MTLSIDAERLTAALDSVRHDLLQERGTRSHWVGRLSSSPLSTATAISALILAEQSGTSCGLPAYTPDTSRDCLSEMYQGDLSELIVHSLNWLAGQQNEDGGWGDTDRSKSNIATTMLVQAAFHLTGVPAKYKDLLNRSDQYVAKAGGLSALKERYEGDRTFVVPILTNCALANMVPWRKVPALPFELACLPQKWYHKLNLPVVSYALPALVAIGQARFHHAPPSNPLMRWIRSSAQSRSLKILEEMQPASGGYLEAIPLTSFVVMSLASMGLGNHAVVRKGVEFLLATAREDGSWPIDSNLATWNTSQALTALDWDVDSQANADEPSEQAEKVLKWLLKCQHKEAHRATGAAPGGWAWTDLSGGIPDADDTSAALLALAVWHRKWPNRRGSELKSAARAGMVWLIDLQNSDGGWPTFCRGWGRLPFDRSSTDITAHAMRGLHAWSVLLRLRQTNPELSRRVQRALSLGDIYLSKQQQSDGSWLPLWFGNQHHPKEANPVYGTAKVLMMYRDLGQLDSESAQRGAHWLAGAQLASGGWGTAVRYAGKRITAKEEPSASVSVEETALAVEALLPFAEKHTEVARAVGEGVSWLTEALEAGQHLEPAPIGFYFAKLWYYEQMYPLVYAASALQAASKSGLKSSHTLETTYSR